jgi:predicted AAA+ superfamily ATPase
LNGVSKLPDVDVYVTGSNSQMLSKDIATNFRDRGFEIRLHPLSFSEYIEATGKDLFNGFEDYLTWGGMPLAVLEKEENERSGYLKGLFDRVYIKDICERHNLRDDYVINRVVDALSSSIGSLTNPHKLSNTLQSVLKVKTNDHTINAYLEYLCDAFLYSRVVRYDVKGKRYFDTPCKYFAEDVGLRNARLNFRQVEDDHLMENVIYNELVARGYNVDVGVVPIASRIDGKLTVRQHEIDFVINLGSKKIYIQSAFSLSGEGKKEQETMSLRKSGDFFRKIVVTSGMKKLTRDEMGIEYVGVIPFLMDCSILG